MDGRTQVWNIGYQRQTIESLLVQLRGAHIQQLIDVRESGGSRRSEFCRRPLANSMKTAGIRYLHRPDAGNPFRQDPTAGLDGYRAHVDARPQLIDALAALVRNHRTALLCMCANRAGCHRGVLLEALEGRGFETIDLPAERQLSLL
jgi:uncharacterized protein (DUF488 family)